MAFLEQVAYWAFLETLVTKDQSDQTVHRERPVSWVQQDLKETSDLQVQVVSLVDLDLLDRPVQWVPLVHKERLASRVHKDLVEVPEYLDLPDRLVHRDHEV